MADYGAQTATDKAVSLLRLLLDDFDYSEAVHRQALVGDLQMAVDLQGMAAGGVVWPAGGGRGNGRKLPLVFAAWAFACTDVSHAVAASAWSRGAGMRRHVRVEPEPPGRVTGGLSRPGLAG